MHNVDLLDQQGPVERAYWAIYRYLEDQMRPPSEWSIVLTELQRDSLQGGEYYDVLR